jgi:4-hydroxybenzoate polyprenyltransferase
MGTRSFLNRISFDYGLEKGLTLSHAIHLLSYHTYTLYLFTRNDIPGVLILSYLFVVSSSLAGSELGLPSQRTPVQLLSRTPTVIFWIWTNLLLFNIHNQRSQSSIAEDFINKPWRPIPAGRISAASAGRLLYFLYPLIIVTSNFIGGLVPCLIEAVLCLWYNEYGGDNHPLIKNLLNGMGFMGFMGGGLEVALENVSLITFPKACKWLAFIGGVISGTVHTQDFRDQEGDRIRGRRTIQALSGDVNARWSVVAGVAVACWMGSKFWALGWVGMLWTGSIGVLMAWNLLSDRTVEGDVLTFKIWGVWIISFFFLPFLP